MNSHIDNRQSGPNSSEPDDLHYVPEPDAASVATREAESRNAWDYPRQCDSCQYWNVTVPGAWFCQDCLEVEPNFSDT